MDSLDNLSVIAAEGQSAGRGQGDHTWFASPGKNITATVVLKPENLDAGDYLFVTRVTTLALLSYLRERGVKARIKWPNDIWVDDRKICGSMLRFSVRLIPYRINMAYVPMHIKAIMIS